MFRMTKVFLFLFIVISAHLYADEGEWPPDELKSLPFHELLKRGLRLSPEDLWTSDGRGLMVAAPDLEGCSSGFVSKDGLILTNYHCAFDAVQQASTVEKNYVRNGFLARTRAEELPARADTRALILKRIEDVTLRVIGPDSSAAKAHSDAERYDAVEKTRKEIVAECEKTPGRRCKVESFYGGSQFKLHERIELKDVRIVYSPPRAVGEYGGEIDNWQWPRHTGDFAVLRAYVSPSGVPAEYSKENVPYHPEFYLPVSRAGIQKGDLILIAGYPRKTQRFLSASAIQDQLEWFYPLRSAVYSQWISILQAEGKNDPDVALRTSAQIKSLSNREKNARGQIAGMNRNHVLDKALEEGRQIRARHPDALEDLEKVLASARRMRDHDFYLNEMPQASNYLGSAMTAVRFAKERQKPDLERLAGYQQRDLENAINKEIDRTKLIAPHAERKALAFLISRTFALPPEQQIQALTNYPEADKDPEAWLASLDSQTRLNDEKVRVANMTADLQALKSSNDPYIQLAIALDSEMDEKIARTKDYDGAMLKVQPPYLLALREIRKGRIYPDANGTLRLSVAEMKGYSPQEAVVMEPQTTLKGVLAKNTGTEPFALPARVIQAANQEKEMIPVCFLGNGDTTSGNSGSPVLNGKGQLVGLNFDRVWENVAGDFGWNPVYSRNIMVDIRYILWLLEKVEHADTLVQEMTRK
jgi:hypothetical protein